MECWDPRAWVRNPGMKPQGCLLLSVCWGASLPPPLLSPWSPWWGKRTRRPRDACEIMFYPQGDAPSKFAAQNWWGALQGHCISEVADVKGSGVPELEAFDSFLLLNLGRHHMNGGGFLKTENILKSEEERFLWVWPFVTSSLLPPWLLFKLPILKARQNVWLLKRSC